MTSNQNILTFLRGCFIFIDCIIVFINCTWAALTLVCVRNLSVRILRLLELILIVLIVFSVRLRDLIVVVLFVVVHPQIRHSLVFFRVFLLFKH